METQGREDVSCRGLVVVLGIGIAPFIGAERRLKHPIGNASAHRLRFRVEQVFVFLDTFPNCSAASSFPSIFDLESLEFALSVEYLKATEQRMTK